MAGCVFFEQMAANSVYREFKEASVYNGLCEVEGYGVAGGWGGGWCGRGFAVGAWVCAVGGGVCKTEGVAYVLHKYCWYTDGTSSFVCPRVSVI